MQGAGRTCGRDGRESAVPDGSVTWGNKCEVSRSSPFSAEETAWIIQNERAERMECWEQETGKGATGVRHRKREKTTESSLSPYISQGSESFEGSGRSVGCWRDACRGTRISII